jgi:hypothetical protein
MLEGRLANRPLQLNFQINIKKKQSRPTPISMSNDEKAHRRSAIPGRLRDRRRPLRILYAVAAYSARAVKPTFSIVV